MPQLDDLTRSPVPLAQESTLIAGMELSQTTWLVAGMVSGHRSTAAQEAQRERGGAARFPAALEGRGNARRADDCRHCGCL
jgi:hypothetical protein